MRFDSVIGSSQRFVLLMLPSFGLKTEARVEEGRDRFPKDRGGIELPLLLGLA